MTARQQMATAPTLFNAKYFGLASGRGGSLIASIMLNTKQQGGYP
jgi:hypothetical protein